MLLRPRDFLLQHQRRVSTRGSYRCGILGGRWGIPDCHRFWGALGQSWLAGYLGRWAGKRPPQEFKPLAALEAEPRAAWALCPALLSLRSGEGVGGAVAVGIWARWWDL